ncbi:MAG: NAD(P)/FAD-dependent oxidoreductase [Bacteroidia bacterium]
MFDIIVIGGGAAGYFSAIQAAMHSNNLRILLLEKSNKVLSKVKVSGGGRCNVTNGIENPVEFASNYPRGGKFMKKILYAFSPADCKKWFEDQGVELKQESDGRVFPITDSSQTVIDCLEKLAEKFGVKLALQEGLENLSFSEDGFTIKTSKQVIKSKTVILASGGSPKNESYNWLRDLGIEVEPPAPSLFTFNCKQHEFNDLMGLSCEAKVSIDGSTVNETGPFLITHWGFSGPAVLKCSAKAARFLQEKAYEFTIRIHWLPELNQDEIREWLQKQQSSSSKRIIKHKVFDALPQRLWEALVERSGIDSTKLWSEIPKKQINILAETLSADRWEIKGKTTFKEEFVTCGGIKLNQLDPNSCMIKSIPGLFAAGELLDIDGVTGGFNFQNAWSTAYVSAHGALAYLKNH